MTIEYLKCRIDFNPEIDFGENGAIGMIATKWDLVLFEKWIVFFHNVINFFKYESYAFNPIRSGGGGLLTLLFILLSRILELPYCALVTFSENNSFTPHREKNDLGSRFSVRGAPQFKFSLLSKFIASSTLWEK